MHLPLEKYRIIEGKITQENAEGAIKVHCPSTMNWLCQLPKPLSMQQKQQTSPAHSLAEQALLLLGEMANEPPLKHTALLDGMIQVVEFKYKGAITRELTTLLLMQGTKTKETIATWNAPEAMFHRVTGSLYLRYEDPEDSKNATIVIFRCGTREALVEVKDSQSAGVRFQLEIETPRMCSNPEFLPDPVYSKARDVVLAPESGKEKVFAGAGGHKVDSRGNEDLDAFLGLWQGISDSFLGDVGRGRSLIDVAAGATSGTQGERVKEAFEDTVGQMERVKEEIEEFVSEFLAGEEESESSEENEEQKLNWSNKKLDETNTKKVDESNKKEDWSNKKLDETNAEKLNDSNRKLYGSNKKLNQNKEEPLNENNNKEKANENKNEILNENQQTMQPNNDQKEDL